ncbi:E3 ubiquitin/ISG15 ligase TRIM25 [Pundamilia nyererei]|uniref:E3 ubiquitin/ISG15 ligase TRIM25 n=1 Tax=Pundamilia nyererei TaxID=303518 RepID=A0A9Y3VL28_9CICH|nr:PREDICTED: E3 ubiquitin/ISG15 ligase TRIM25-like [Pundamilia nyererei]
MSLSKPEDQLAYELSCPICLQLYSDPVALPCGHNYCLFCIRKTIDSTDKTGKILPRCPECREEYPGTDNLQINFKLRSIIENYKATALLLNMQADCVDTKMEVFCDQCIDEQSPAVKTCLKCEVSLCSRHLQKHHKKELFRTHPVVEPTTELRVKACAIHQRPLEYFCSNDMMSLCTTCVVEGHHESHDVLIFSVAEEEMRRALEARNKVISSRLQLTEGLLQKTAEDQGTSEAVGEKMVSKAVTVMDSIGALVDRYRDRLLLLLEEERGQRRKSWQLGVSALEEQQQQLMEAQKSATEVLNETDTCIFIHRFMQIEQKLRHVVTSAISSNIPSKAPLNNMCLQGGLKTQDFCTEMTRLMDSLHILLNPLELTFSIFTAHPNLLVSNDLRTVKYSSNKQSYPEHPERFTSAPQILCSQGFSGGEHVWVVEVGPNSMWSLGVCYKSIPRRGDHSRLGHNTVSWRLQWKNGKLTVCQCSSNVVLKEVTTPPVKIEVALDYEGGTLTFHSTKGRREHLHTLKAVFKEPVYPVFSILSNTPDSWITLSSGM